LISLSLFFFCVVYSVPNFLLHKGYDISIKWVGDKENDVILGWDG
jgi:hypothetical protein